MAMRYVGTLLKNVFFCLFLGISCLYFAPSAQAQLFFSRIPPADIVNIVRNRGFYDVENPYFRGDVYVIDATERRGLRVRLIVDPRTGDIVERLIIGRNNRVYPAGPNGVGSTRGVERQVLEQPSLDDEKHSRSSVDIDEPNSRIRQVRPTKKRAKQESSVEIITPSVAQPALPQPFLPRPQIIEAPKDEPLKLPSSNPNSQPSSVELPKTQMAPSSGVPSTSKQLEPLTPTLSSPNNEQIQRGTKENPRKVGPIIPLPIGVQ